MKIGSISASLHRHEIDLPNIGKSIESRMFVFVEVETDDGLKGFGITGSILPWAVMACIEHHLAPALKGATSFTRGDPLACLAEAEQPHVYRCDFQCAVGHRRRAVGYPRQEGKSLDP